MATTTHRHIGPLCKITDCETCERRMVEALESLGYIVTVKTEYECAECRADLKAVDGEWWHAGEAGDYQPVSHAAAPVPVGATE